MVSRLLLEWFISVQLARDVPYVHHHHSWTATCSGGLFIQVEGLSELKDLLFLDVSNNAIEKLPAAAVPQSVRFLQVRSLLFTESHCHLAGIH